MRGSLPRASRRFRVLLSMPKKCGRISWCSISPAPGLSFPDLQGQMKSRGVLISTAGGTRARTVTHLNVSRQDCEIAVQTMGEVLCVAPRKLSDARRHFRRAHDFENFLRPRPERAAAQAGHAARHLSFLRLRISGALFALGFRAPSRRRSRSSPRDARCTCRPLNERGEILNRILEPLLAPHPHWENFALEDGALHGTLKPLPALFPEEERSKQPSAFSILRALLDEFRHPHRVATRAGRRVRLRSAVSVRSHRAEAAAPRRQGSAPLSLRRHLFHGSQEGADRALPVRFRARRI